MSDVIVQLDRITEEVMGLFEARLATYAPGPRSSWKARQELWEESVKVLCGLKYLRGSLAASQVARLDQEDRATRVAEESRLSSARRQATALAHHATQLVQLLSEPPSPSDGPILPAKISRRPSGKTKTVTTGSQGQ